MTQTFAYECFADEDVFRFLRPGGPDPGGESAATRRHR